MQNAQEPLALLMTLRKILKKNGITYEKLSKEMDISLATTKRWMRDPNIGLTQLMNICQIVGISLATLEELAAKEAGNWFPLLTTDQENELANDFLLFGFWLEYCNSPNWNHFHKYHNMPAATFEWYVERLVCLDLLRRDRKGNVTANPKNKVFSFNGPIYKAHTNKLIESMVSRIKKRVESLTEPCLSSEIAHKHGWWQVMRAQRMDRASFLDFVSEFNELFKKHMNLALVKESLTPEESLHNASFLMFGDFSREPSPYSAWAIEGPIQRIPRKGRSADPAAKESKSDTKNGNSGS